MEMLAPAERDVVALPKDDGLAQGMELHAIAG